MKYMHFNSSCAYAGLANQLLLMGHSTEDEQIVKTIGLPWHIAYDPDTQSFCSGTMLQGKKWFDRYLLPLGWEYEEQTVQKADVLGNLRKGDMIGVELQPGWKHAVIFLEKTGDTVRVLNNKYEASEGEEVFTLCASEFLAMIPEEGTVGRVVPAEKESISQADILTQSRDIWRQYRDALLNYLHQYHSFEELWESRDPLFRALLVDTLTMMTLIREEALAAALRQLQSQYMAALKKREGLVLADHLDMKALNGCFDVLCSK